MSETTQTPTCSRCGAPLSPDALRGLCPRCLMALNLAAPTEIPGEVGPHGTRVIKPPPPPADIAKYFPQLQIIECLGRGGMGVLYKARQPKLNRFVALKLLAPEKVAETRFAERFEREAQALARLNHPNIVTVYDFGEADGLYYLLMEFVDGASLRQLLQKRKIAPEEALAIVPKICEALQFAHEQGVVHRDIKPENVLLDKQGRVKIADFGIAKIVGGAEQPLSPEPGERGNAPAGEGALTEGQILGTPHYMAPEQMEKPQLVDHRADIYSLGVVFYEMLTGELPLGKFPPPSKKVHVDVRLDDVVLRTLEKEPELRYQRASQVKTDVETIAKTQDSKSLHETSRAPAPVLIRKRSVAWKFPLTIVLALLIGVGVLLLTKILFGRSGLVSWWPAEGNANDVVGKNNGSLFNNVTFAPGVAGQAFSFNGTNSYIEIPNSPSLNFSREFTVALWFKDLGSQEEFYGLIAKRGVDPAPCNFGIHGNPRGLYGIQSYFLDRVLRKFSVSNYSPIPLAGEFHHFAVSFRQADSSHVEVKLFIDGQSVSSTALSGNLANTLNDEPVIIGATKGANGIRSYFRGLIDEVMIFKRALSAGEVEAQFSSGARKIKASPSPAQQVEKETQLVSEVTFGSSQSYPPETDYHDAVQRVFVLEAARVLAWRANRGGDHISEISYQLGIKTNQSVATTVTSKSLQSTNRVVVWKIEWLDTEAKTNKTATVEYPEELLKQGPQFYRQTFKQLWAAGWKPRMTDCAAGEEDYWQGAGRADWSRERSLIAAESILASVRNRDNESWIPEMAGLLVHAALPGIAGNLSLDRALIARGAAWLALSEQGCPSPATRLWSPVLFLAEREQAASAVWREVSSPTVTNELVTAWNLWLRRPTSKEAFLFAVDSDCSPIALAMVAYDVQANGSSHLLEEFIVPLAGNERRLTSWHNYAPLLARWGGIGGGRLLEGAWPVYQRRAWLELMKQHSPSAHEKIDLTKELVKAGNTQDDSEADASLAGFTHFAPLLRLGFSEGCGKLVPTAVASTRDLLNYGWESTGLQMGERYSFMRWRWGVPELAKPILQTVTRDVEGLMPFFLNAAGANTHNYQESLRRLQMVDGFQFRMGWSPNPFWGEVKGNKSAEVFVQRCWLRSSDFEWQARSLWDEDKIRRISELVDAIKSESGPLAATRALRYLISIGPNSPKAFWRVADANPSLAAMLSQPTEQWVTAIWNEKFAELSPLATAQELERAYWRNPDSGIESLVLHYYCQSGAFSAARRFYLQARENFFDPVKVSNGVGETAFVLGYCLDDAALRETAVKDSACGSFGDMMIRAWDAAVRDDRNTLKQVADEMIERYEPKEGAESEGRRLRDFLPLLDVLADVKHSNHKQAVEFFGNYNRWIFLRWIWVEKFKLPKDDAITFLGGREANPTVHPLVCALAEDAANAKNALNDRIKKNDIITPMMVLASYNCRKLTKESFNVDSPDLKPSDATFTRAAVLARLKAKNGRN